MAARKSAGQALDQDEQLAERAAKAHEDALVDEQGEESFPASDPPSSWAGPPDGGPPPREGAPQVP